MQATGFKATPMVGTTTVTGRRYESFRRVSLLGLDRRRSRAGAGPGCGEGGLVGFSRCRPCLSCLSVHLCKVAQRVTLANAYTV